MTRSQIEPGVYTTSQTIFIDKTLSIVGTGSNPETVQINGNSDLDANVVVASGADVTFSNLTISTDLVQDAEERFAVVNLENSTVDVDRVVVSGGSGFGLVLDNVDGTVRNSRFADNGFGGMLIEAAGSTLIVEFNDAQRNGDGFQVRENATPTLRYNDASANLEAGFSWYDDAGGTVIGNTANNNGHSGFYLDDRVEVLLEDNTAAGNSEAASPGSVQAPG